MIVQFDNIPVELKKIPRWVLWRETEIGEAPNNRMAKLPFQVSGHKASSTNPNNWSDFFTVEDAYQKGNYSGVGFVFVEDDNLVGIDLDDVRDIDSGELTPFAQNIVDNVIGYSEVSPSGTGLKIFTRGDFEFAHVDHDLGFEAYSKGRYFTVTGNKLGGGIPTEVQDLTGIIPKRTAMKSGDSFGDYTPPLAEYDLHRVETELLSQITPDHGYADWLQVGQMLHHQFGGDDEACDLWNTWSQQGTSYSETGDYSCSSKWKTFKGSGMTLRSLIFKVNQTKIKEAIANGEIILDSNPMTQAKIFLDAQYKAEEGFTLVHYADDFHSYDGTHYETIEEATIRSGTYKFLDKCKKLGRKGEILEFAPNPASVSAVIDAIKSICHLPNNGTTRPPIWLEEFRSNRPPAYNLVSLKNGLFNMADNILLQHSLGFFTQNSLNFGYDKDAQCPTWHDFLKSAWEDDQASIDLLQEYFGYILSGDNRQQKFLNAIGPRRSGKGTINNVLVALLGQHNTVAPELGELCDTFGLQSWLGKMLATFTDARAPERNRNAVVSQLLRIVGNDPVTVNRKNRESWGGTLGTRIIVFSNEVLQLSESSNALTGRMLVLKMTKSFYGNEDTDLGKKLEKELNGIFLWAMEGNARRLARGGKFIQPASGADYLQLMADIGNPMQNFIEDTLDFGADYEVAKDDIFSCYSHWCLKKKLNAGNELAFKRRFIAASQEHKVESALNRTGGDRKHIYRGIRLNERAQTYMDSIVSFESDGAY